MLRHSLILAGALAVLSTGSFAQSGADASYCHKLSAAYRDFARAGQIDADAALAMGQCEKDAAKAIPVLEKILNTNKVKLPART